MSVGRAPGSAAHADELALVKNLGALTGTQISVAEADAPLFGVLEGLLEVAPLCALVLAYREPFVSGPSYYDMGHPWRVGSIPAETRVRVKSLPWFLKNLDELLVPDALSEVEFTQDCNMGGSYYRVHVRTRHPYMHIRGDNETLVKPKYAYQIVPLGGPDDDWPMCFGGPTLEALPERAVYRLSNGAVFDLFHPETYQCIFVRRP